MSEQIGNITVNLSDSWVISENTYVKGRAFSNGRYLKGKKLTDYLRTSKDIKKACAGLNGFFSFVIKGPDSVVIGADRTRSIPLFYGINDRFAYISDNPYWIKDQTGDSGYDEISEKEFLLLGFVSGKDTLFKNVKQIQAGEIISFSKDTKDTDSVIKISPSRYYRFIHKNYFEMNREQLFEAHESVLTEAFQRLIRLAGGRTIVLPLSGGYDSRLVASTLKRLGYNNIIAFSFGKPGNNDSVMSKRVAEKLGIQWLFIPYDNEKTYKWYNSEERKEYGIKADCAGTILQDREWPAVYELKKQGLIPDDSIFVPGHSGDFTAGGWIPKKFLRKNVQEDEFIDTILNKHYIMWNWKAGRDKLRSAFAAKILENVEAELFNIQTDAANAYEKWQWQEDEVKHHTNSTRIYEYFGYEWWMPLWDSEYMDFWSRVPLKWRFKKRLYKECVFLTYSQTAQVSMREARLRDSSLNTESIINRIIRKLQSLIKYKNDLRTPAHELMESDWEQSFGRININLYKKLLPYIVGRASCSTLERLGYINYTDSGLPEKTMTMLRDMKGR